MGSTFMQTFTSLIWLERKPEDDTVTASIPGEHNCDKSLQHWGIFVFQENTISHKNLKEEQCLWFQSLQDHATKFSGDNAKWDVKLKPLSVFCTKSMNNEVVHQLPPPLGLVI